MAAPRIRRIRRRPAARWRASTAPQAGYVRDRLISIRQSNMKSTRNTERTGWLAWKYSA
jgi:hypothetical protein